MAGCPSPLHVFRMSTVCVLSITLSATGLVFIAISSPEDHLQLRLANGRSESTLLPFCGTFPTNMFQLAELTFIRLGFISSTRCLPTIRIIRIVRFTSAFVTQLVAETHHCNNPISSTLWIFLHSFARSFLKRPSQATTVLP